MNISDIGGLKKSAESPPAVMTGTQDTAGSSSATVSATNKDKKPTKPLRPTASVFVPGVLEVQDPERTAPGNVYSPYKIFQTTQQSGPGYVYNSYNVLHPTQRAVPGMMTRYAPQRQPFGGYGPGSVSSDQNQIEEAKYNAKQNVHYFQGIKPKARADVPAKKQKERGEDGMTSKARKRSEVRARRRADKATAIDEEYPETSAE